MTDNHMNDSTGFALTRTCRQMRRRMHTLLGDVGLHRGQHFVLHALWDDEGRAQSELARHARVRPATMTTMLQRMERDGIIERRQDPEDQRISRVYLTDAGRELKEAAQRAWRQIEQEAFMGFSEDESAALRELLERVRVNLSDSSDLDGGRAA
jgi:DNA-binding MarR family transcriptional regulator